MKALSRIPVWGRVPGSVARCRVMSDVVGATKTAKVSYSRSSVASAAANDEKRTAGSKPCESCDVRNVGIIAHIDAGKTTTTERMLYYAGSIHQLGNVDDGNTTTDFMQQERARGITIQSAAVTFHWKGKKINLVDTPGHVDFTFEVGRCLHVLDGAVAVLDASSGVEAQTMTVWQQANSYALPRIVYLNKMDKRGANLDTCLDSVRKRLKCKPLLVHLPLGCEKDFEGIVDLPTMMVHRWPLSLAHLRGDGSIREMRPLTSADGNDLWRTAQEHRARLVDDLAEIDEEVLAKALSASGGYSDLSAEDVEHALRRVTSACSGSIAAVPVVCGSSYRNCGVQPLLDAIVMYLPSPVDESRPLYRRLRSLYGDDLCAFSFKTVHDRHRGVVTFVRLYTGELRSGTTVYNASRQRSEKVTRISEVFANEHEDVARAVKGDIVALTGLKETFTGDTLVLSQAAMKRALTSTLNNAAPDSSDDETESGHLADASPILAGIPIPDPVFMCSIEAPTPSHQKLLDTALGCLLKEDPSLRMKVDSETGQTILMGMGELHLEVVKDRITVEHGVEAYMGPLQISYRETLAAATEASAVIEKVIADVKNQVSLTMCILPRPGSGTLKEIELVKTKDNDFSSIRRPQLQAIMNGTQAALSAGPILGFPVVDVEVQLISFAIGERRTSLAVIAACASECVRKAVLASQCHLLEPFVQVEVTCQEQHLQVVLHDLARRRSTTHAVRRTALDNDENAADGICVLQAEVPLSDLIGYATKLRTITSGTGTFTMAISGYVGMSQEDTARVTKRTSKWNA